MHPLPPVYVQRNQVQVQRDNVQCTKVSFFFKPCYKNSPFFFVDNPIFVCNRHTISKIYFVKRFKK